MPEIPFKKDVPDHRTVVPGIWSDAMNDLSASFETINNVTRQNVNTELKKTAFNEISVAQNIPITQVTGQYSLFKGTLLIIDDGVSGSTSTVDSKFRAETGTASNGLAAILTSRQLAYRAGQGALARISAIFDTPTADHQQAAGLINAEDAFAFGSVGVDFGVIHSQNGVVEAQELTITTPAGGAENATVTIDGTAHSIPLTADTVEVNAFEIAEFLTDNDLTHRSTSNGATVYVINIISEPSGAYTFSSATAIAAFVQQAAGLEPDVTLIKQADWNQDAKTDLVITNLNDYQIQYNGVIEFSIQDATTGNIDLVHRIEHTNNNTRPSSSNPIFRVGWLTRNRGNTTNKFIEGSFASSFIEGIPTRDTEPRAFSANALSIGTSATSIITIRNRSHFNDKINRITSLLKFLSFSTQANKPAFFELIINPDFASPIDFEYADKDNSIIEFATDNVGVSGGQVAGALSVEAGAPLVLDIEPSTLTAVGPNTTFCVAARVASGAAGDMQATVTIQEDF